jgi:hypothetical protein
MSCELRVATDSSLPREFIHSFIYQFINIMKDLFRPLALVYSSITQGSRSPSGLELFSYEKMLPPLPKLQPNTKYGKAIPVLYTNDPSSASRWLEEHLSERPITVGWDVEVSKPLLSQISPFLFFLGMLNIMLLTEICML